MSHKNENILAQMSLRTENIADSRYFGFTVLSSVQQLLKFPTSIKIAQISISGLTKFK